MFLDHRFERIMLLVILSHREETILLFWVLQFITGFPNKKRQKVCEMNTFTAVILIHVRAPLVEVLRAKQTVIYLDPNLD